MKYRMMMTKKGILFSLIFFFFVSLSFTQEALKSIEEDYYDFLSLNGTVARPTLGYKTLSDNIWEFSEIDSESHIWSNLNLGSNFLLWQASSPVDNWFTRGIEQSLTAKVYGPEWVNSYNTASPYGQNDGGLWQGCGYNTAFTAGARLEGYGFEATFKPQVSWMQNREYEYIKPNYTGETYKDKAEKYGYYGVTSVDVPQRFGDSPFWNFDWGDSEIRYSLYSFTVGFGTQSIWLGPAKLNPIMHSNNASSYPKLDIGFRKTELKMPYWEWYLGSIELRGWWGKLTESDWFDNDNTNDNTLISGLSINYQLPFFRDLTFGLNRTMLSAWKNMSSYTLFKIYNPSISSGTSGGKDESDQRVSFTIDYNIKNAGFEVYLEWARNDFSPNRDYYIRYPFHTAGWTFGTEKTFDLPWNLKGAFLLELTFLECSADYDRLISWYSTFYAHHEIKQGYTNNGQWLGAGIGTGGNSQYFGLTVYYPRGSVLLFMQRRNPDLDYSMYIDSRANGTQAEKNIRAELNFGISGLYYFTDSFNVQLQYILNNQHNPLNVASGNTSIHRYNNYINLSLSYKI